MKKDKFSKYLFYSYFTITKHLHINILIDTIWKERNNSIFFSKYVQSIIKVNFWSNIWK